MLSTKALRSPPPSSTSDHASARRAIRRIEGRFDQLVKIRNATNKCLREGAPEPSWNEKVHGQMLNLAIEDNAGVDYYNITTARPVRALVPSTITGDLLDNKLVDYCIALSESSISTRKIIDKLSGQPQPLSSAINGIVQEDVRFRPIAVSIETKIPWGEDPLPQLSVWVATHFQRLRRLLPPSVDGHEVIVDMTLPLLAVSGSRWNLVFAKDTANGIVRVSSLYFPLKSSSLNLLCLRVKH
jgi:hypothetical protein